MLRLIIVLHVVESIEFVEDKNLLIHRTLGADRTAYSLSIRINGDSSQLSFFVSSFRERLIVFATFSERTISEKQNSKGTSRRLPVPLLFCFSLELVCSGRMGANLGEWGQEGQDAPPPPFVLGSFSSSCKFVEKIFRGHTPRPPKLLSVRCSTNKTSSENVLFDL